jgi:hypothetical protein
VEAQVLQQHHLPARGAVDRLLDRLADAVVAEDDALAQQLLELGHDGPEAELVVALPVRAAEVRHEHDDLGAVLHRIVDGRQRADDALVVGHLLVGVERDVEVDL